MGGSGAVVAPLRVTTTEGVGASADGTAVLAEVAAGIAADLLRTATDTAASAFDDASAFDEDIVILPPRFPLELS
jgi:hypothetical protein